MKTEFNLSWNEALEAMQAGKLVARRHWIETDEETTVLCRRPDDTITEDLVPNIKTLPLALKSYIQRTGKGPVHFRNDFCVYCTKSRLIINGWDTSTDDDIDATDWGIIGE